MDVNEYSLINNSCRNGKCVNMIGTYQCDCNPGYQTIPERQDCMDIDEYLIINGGNAIQCNNSEDSCEYGCSEGYALMSDMRTCADIDEYENTPEICAAGQCTNIPGEYLCLCYDGFIDSIAMEPCNDVNACDLNSNICMFGDCERTKGSFICHCQLVYSGKKGTTACTDVDEYYSGSHQSSRNVQCVNTPFSYCYNCLEGMTKDDLTCLDNDECLENIHISENGQCINIPTTYCSECEMGFTPGSVSKFFQDEDQSDNLINCVGDQYKHNFSSDFQLSTNGVACMDNRVGNCDLRFGPHGDGGYSCSTDIGVGVGHSSFCSSLGKAWANSCDSCSQANSTEYYTLCQEDKGFRPNPITPILVDLDECQELPDLCQSRNSINSFGNCECPQGYYLSDETGICEDIGEYFVHPLACDPETLGNCTWICPPEYMQIRGGHNCMDMKKTFCYRNYNKMNCENELPFNVTKMCCCTNNGKVWHKQYEPYPAPEGVEFKAIYENISGFAFKIHTGKVADAVDFETCLLNIDECKEIPDICGNDVSIKQSCSLHCECPTGFNYNDLLIFCEDVDAHDYHPWNTENGTWRNTGGFYNCLFYPGFELTHNDCLNECSSFFGQMCRNGQCFNETGSFKYLCNNEYELNTDGKNHIDTNEYNEDPNICFFGSCTNIPGALQRIYPTGLVLSNNGRKCIDTCQICFKNFENVICTISTTFNTTKAKCCCGNMLEDGWGDPCDPCPKGDGDVNECFKCSGICSSVQSINTDGSFCCEYPMSYNIDYMGLHYVDENECWTKPESYENGHCINTIGKYKCKHNEEFQPNLSSIQSNDKNECTNSNVCGSASCYNTFGSYKCACICGFSLDQFSSACHDLNECSSANNPCNYACTNTEGGYLCSCPLGHYRVRQGQCISVMGLNKSQHLSMDTEVDKQNTSSSEACYECKVNGYTKNESRQKRNINETKPTLVEKIILKSMDMDTTIKMKFNLSSLGNKFHILEVMTAIKSFNNYIQYIISQGNKNGILQTHQQDGLSYLHIAKNNSGWNLHNGNHFHSSA